MHEYRRQFMKIGANRTMPGGMHWVFLGCGDSDQKAFEKLYNTSADEAERFNFLQELTDGRARIVPFTRQPVLQLEGRADTTLTRSSGITCGELLALAKRGDERRVLLHIEVPETMHMSLSS